jgi:hypothetical protein
MNPRCPNLRYYSITRSGLAAAATKVAPRPIFTSLTPHVDSQSSRNNPAIGASRGPIVQLSHANAIGIAWSNSLLTESLLVTRYGTYSTSRSRTIVRCSQLYISHSFHRICALVGCCDRRNSPIISTSAHKWCVAPESINHTDEEEKEDNLSMRIVPDIFKSDALSSQTQQAEESYVPLILHPERDGPITYCRNGCTHSSRLE